MLKSFLPSFTLLFPYIFPSSQCLDPYRLLPHVFFHPISQTLTKVNQRSILHEVIVSKPFLSSILSFSPWHPMLLFYPLLLFAWLSPTFLYICLLLTRQEELNVSLSHLLHCLTFLVFHRLNIFYRHFHMFLELHFFFSFSRNLLNRHPYFCKAR